MPPLLDFDSLTSSIETGHVTWLSRDWTNLVNQNVVWQRNRKSSFHSQSVKWNGLTPFDTPMLEQDILSEISFVYLLFPGQFFIYKTRKWFDILYLLIYFFLNLDFTPKGQCTTMTERVANVNQYQYADQVHNHDAALKKDVSNLCTGRNIRKQSSSQYLLSRFLKPPESSSPSSERPLKFFFPRLIKQYLLQYFK